MTNTTSPLIPTVASQSPELTVLDGLASSITGLVDLGYKHSVTRKATSELALVAADLIPGFPENVEEESKNKVYEGYRLHKSELMGERYFIREGLDTYTEVDDKDTMLEGEYWMVLDVDYAFSFSQQQFGALKEKQPNLHRLIGEVRKDVSKYCSGTWASLVATYKALNREGRERSANKSFMEYLDETFETMRKKRKVAHNREDAGSVPSDAALKAAIDAFYTDLG